MKVAEPSTQTAAVSCPRLPAQVHLNPFCLWIMTRANSKCSGIFSFSPRCTWDGWLVPSYRVFSNLLLFYCCSRRLAQPQPGSNMYNPGWCAWQVCANSAPSQPGALHHRARAFGPNTTDCPASQGLGPQSPRRGAPPRTHPARSPEAAIQIPAGTTNWCKNTCTVREKGFCCCCLSWSRKKERERIQMNQFLVLRPFHPFAAASDTKAEPYLPVARIQCYKQLPCCNA